MATLEQSIKVLELNPDRAQNELSKALIQRGVETIELYQRLHGSLRANQEIQVPTRDLAAEIMAPLEIYQRDECGKFIFTGTISLVDIYRITVLKSAAISDQAESGPTQLGHHAQSVQHFSIEGELKTGGYARIGVLETTRGVSTHRVIEKEFVPIRFQRDPESPIEEAYIRCTSSDTVVAVPFHTELCNRTDPDYPEASFYDSKLLERTSIRINLIR